MHPFHHHFVTFLAACAVSIGASALVLKPEKPKAPVIVAGKQMSEARAQRLARTAYAELDQDAVDGITAELQKLPAKEPVLILCDNDDRCGEIALNLENSFESAKWEVNVEKPAFATGVGISTNSPEMAAALLKGARIEAKVLQRGAAETVFIELGNRQ